MQQVFVGDVQGCADEFAELVERARSDFGGEFELWLVGDLVNRGPDNLRALRMARELVESGRGHYVLGNHELALLRVALGLAPLRARDSFGDVLAAPDAEDWVAWLRRRPLVETGRLGCQDFALVHAANHPEWRLARLRERAAEVEARLAAPDRRELELLLSGPHEPDSPGDVLGRLTRCRSVAGQAWHAEPPEFAPPGYEAWHRAWSRHDPDHAIVYGHWALQGLHVASGLRGLDTGCVHHGHAHEGRLTAWLPAPDNENPFGLPDERFWQIPARRVYYAAAT